MAGPAAHGGLAVLVMLTLWSVRTAMTVCVQDGPCKCTSDRGTIDLSPIQGSPPFKDILDNSGIWLFSYSPCRSFSEGSGQCENVTVCQLYSNYSAESYPVGSLESATFRSDSDSTTITYNETDGTGVTRTTIVELICDTSGKPDTLRVQGEIRATVYHMTLTSSHCCPSKNPDIGPDPGPGPGNSSSSSNSCLSVKFILCIVIVVVAFVYMVWEIAMQKAIRKARAKEIAFNYNLRAPFLRQVKDGTYFTVRESKGGNTYKV